MAETGEWQQSKQSSCTSDLPASRIRAGFDWSQAPAPWNEIGLEFRRICKECLRNLYARGRHLSPTKDHLDTRNAGGWNEYFLVNHVKDIRRT